LKLKIMNHKGHRDAQRKGTDYGVSNFHISDLRYGLLDYEE